MNRRTMLIGTSALLPLTALGACGIFGSTTTNGVQTITINVSQLIAWGQAIVNAASLIGALPGIVGTPAAAVINGIVPTAASDLAAFNAATAGQVTLTFDRGSVPASVQSLLADGQTLLSDVTNTNVGIPSTGLANAQVYITALATIVSLFQAAVGASVTAKAAASRAPMTEGAALKTLKVSK